MNVSDLTPYEWAQKERKAIIKELPVAGQNHPRIVWYHAFTTLKATTDEVPWCSAFMCAAAASCGYPSTKSALARSWAKYGDEGTGEVGDIVILSRGNSTTTGHVGFINSQYRKGDEYVEILGGNQNNCLSVAKFKADRIVAIRSFPAKVA